MDRRPKSTTEILSQKSQNIIMIIPGKEKDIHHQMKKDCLLHPPTNSTSCWTGVKQWNSRIALSITMCLHWPRLIHVAMELGLMKMEIGYQ